MHYSHISLMAPSFNEFKRRHPEMHCHPCFPSEKVSSHAPQELKAVTFVLSQQRRMFTNHFLGRCFANVHSPHRGLCGKVGGGRKVGKGFLSPKVLFSQRASEVVPSVILFSINCTQRNGCWIFFLFFPLFPLPLFQPMV